MNLNNNEKKCEHGNEPLCLACYKEDSHTQESGASYEQSERSHTHCWNQGKVPACGLTGEHLKCCLCGVVHPTPAEWEEIDIRGAIVEMTSTMLDNPKGNIYPTGKFYDRMESFIRTQIARAREEGIRQGRFQAKEQSWREGVYKEGMKDGRLSLKAEVEALQKRIMVVATKEINENVAEGTVVFADVILVSDLKAFLDTV